ncbi:MAG: YceI family protein [Bacteroidota bacterium]
MMKIVAYITCLFTAIGLSAFIFESNTSKETTATKKTAQKYVLITDKSEISWKGSWIAPDEAGQMVEVKHHVGTIQLTHGEITQFQENISGAFLVNMATIKNSYLTGKENEKLEAHLKSADFFTVEKYGEAKITLKNIKKGDAQITLEIMDTKLEETVPLSVAKKGDQLILEGEFGIDMSPLEFKMMSPNPEKPEEGHIDPTVDFTLKATLQQEK